MSDTTGDESSSSGNGGCGRWETRCDHLEEPTVPAASMGSVALSEAAEANRVEFAVAAKAETGRRYAQALSKT